MTNKVKYTSIFTGVFRLGNDIAQKATSIYA